MKKTFLLAFTAVAALFATSCQKEDLGRVLTATIEQYEHSGNAKAYINNDNYACWENNDKVKINGHDYTVSISEGNEHNYSASIPGTESLEGDLLAFYPASQVSRWNENNVTISLPQVQTYEEHNGHQIINNPMAAYCPADSNKLKFRNLCALLKVTIQAPNNEGLAVKTILVKGNENQMLWGSAPLILDYQNKPMLGEMSNGSAYVGLSFGNDPATISANFTKSFYIVVPAGSDFFNFTIYVVTNQNEIYKKKTPLGHTLPRNHIGAISYTLVEDDVDSVSTILYEGSIEGFCSDAFGEAQVIFNECGILNFDSPLTTIGDFAFESCSGLSSITLPTGVTSIGNLAFYGCSSLSSITLHTGVTSIGDGAFINCSSLSSITLPTGVTSIGGGAFYGCSSLSRITLPESLTSIGNEAFSHCSSLSSITLHTGVTSIGMSAFESCVRLESISLPATLNSLGNYAFYGCSSLKTVYVNRWVQNSTPPDNITQGGSSMFYNCPLNEDGIYVPAGAVDTYKRDPYWSTYEERIKAQQ